MLPRPAPWMVAAKEVMNPDVITVRDDMTVQEVAAFLTENQISGAPVEDGEGRLVGVVSYADIARAAKSQPAITDRDTLAGLVASAGADGKVRVWTADLKPLADLVQYLGLWPILHSQRDVQLG